MRRSVLRERLDALGRIVTLDVPAQSTAAIKCVIAEALQHFSNPQGVLRALFPERAGAPHVQLLVPRNNGRSTAVNDVMTFRTLALEVAAHIRISNLTAALTSASPASVISPSDKKVITLLTHLDVARRQDGDGMSCVVLYAGESF